MEMRTLGRTGMQVSKFCFGAAMFGYFGNRDTAECARMVDRALDAGINYFDVADVYSHGEAESILGAALKGRRENVILATKFGLPMGGGDQNQRGGSRRWIMRAVEDSLRRLDTDYIDLYQMHRADAATDIDETLGALSDLVRAGKVRYIGCSTFPAEMIVEAHWTAERRNRERFRTEQSPYSLFARRIEADVLPTVQRHGMSAVVWSPLAQGWLSGKWRRGDRPADTQRQNLQPQLYDMERPVNQRKLDLIEQLEAVAAQAGISLMHLAMAFVTAHPAVTAAIIGPRTLAHLDGLLAGAHVTLDAATLDAIDAIVPPGTNVSSDDDGYTAPEIEDKALRRRLQAEASHDSFREQMQNIEKFKAANAG